MTQCERVLRHLQDNKKLTTMEAFSDYGITRLAARIHDLRQRGYDITSTITAGKNRYGERTSYTTYTLE